MFDAKVETLINEVDRRLAEYRQKYRGLSWRNKVLLLVEVSKSFKKLGKHTDPLVAEVGSRERIRLYLVNHTGVVISAAELEVVSGISEYRRRTGELRVQDGYKIMTGLTSNDPEVGIKLKSTEYLLLDPKPDLTAARRWHIANRIRRDKILGSQAKILRYLKENVGQIVTTEELAYIAQDKKQYARRTRELRTEQGYAIATKFTGRPDLKMGEYILESSERVAEPHDRKIPFEIQKKVYERSDTTCELCGWNRDRWTRKDPRILELHHVTEHATGGLNTPENLVVLCSRCHDDIHAGRKQIPSDIIG
ncbi:MAG: HNH endonuclease signature motif containing protein [Planctomycetota bacterium]|nr:HNH endonuclease signature motif containing protein [Planctomycetota bacterium]